MKIWALSRKCRVVEHQGEVEGQEASDEGSTVFCKAEFLLDRIGLNISTTILESPDSLLFVIFYEVL